MIAFRDSIAPTARAPVARREYVPPPRSRFIPGPPTVYDAIDSIQELLDAMPDNGTPRRVLEAGCGSAAYLRLRPADYVVGIDISRKQLARNRNLNEKVLGDLQTYALPRQQFDIVVCWYVLEHVARPDLALENMIASMRPGGLLILGLPSALSPKGLVTKLTPHWFHVLIYRYVFRRKNAGRDDQPPFPTHMRWSIRMQAIERLADEQGLDVVGLWRFEDYSQRKLRTRSMFFRRVYAAANTAARATTLGACDLYLTDFAAVLQRPTLSRDRISRFDDSARLTLNSRSR